MEQRKAGQSESLPADYDKVRLAILNRGFPSVAEFSRRTGHEVSWISHISKTGGVNKPMLVWLNHFGIEYDEIKPDPVERQDMIPMTVRELTKDDLKVIITAALKAALNA